MKISIVIPVRITSKRLPGKHLLHNGTKTFIENLYENLQDIIALIGIDVDIFFAIPENKQNELMASFLKFNEIPFFVGDEDNVYERIRSFYAKRDYDWIIRVNGDNVYLVTSLFKELFKNILEGEFDLITNVYPRSFPKGCSVEAIKFKKFNELKHKINKSNYDKEHVMSAFYKEPSINIKNIESSIDLSCHSLSLDNKQDLTSILEINKENISKLEDEVNLSRICIKKEEYMKKNPFLGKNGVFTIAEVGGNHEGCFEYAKELIRLACRTDSDCVKLQIYSPHLLVNKLYSQKRFDHFKKFTLDRDKNKELIKIIKDSGKKVSASIWSVEEIRDYGPDLDFFKIGSGDLTDILILDEIYKTGKPVIISTGLSDMKQIEKALSILDPNKDRQSEIGILQCTSMYPIKNFESNLNVMNTYKSLFSDYIIGYSDHTVGIDALSCSVSMGAEILEYHFTDNKNNRDFRDHLVSLDPLDVQNLIKEIIKINSFKGEKKKCISPSELVNKHQQSFRKGLFLKHNLKKGDVVKKTDLIGLRPNIGLCISQAEEIIGKKVNTDIKSMQKLSKDIFYE